jgi:hypothetical protein
VKKKLSIFMNIRFLNITKKHYFWVYFIVMNSTWESNKNKDFYLIFYIFFLSHNFHIDNWTRKNSEGINVENHGRNFIRFHCYSYSIHDSRGCRRLHGLKGNYFAKLSFSRMFYSSFFVYKNHFIGPVGSFPFFYPFTFKLASNL